MATTAQRYAQASHGLAGESYDADEEDERVGFAQDPEEDEGTGTWTMADGSTRYGPGDPEEGRRLAQTVAPPAEPAPAVTPEPAPTEEEDDFEIISGLEEEAPAAPAAAPAPAPEARTAEMRPGETAPEMQLLGSPTGQDRAQLASAPPAPAAAPPAGAQPVTAPIDIPKSSRIASEHNNPGNLKYAGQAGAVRGEKAGDGGYFAKFETPEMGVAALRKQIDLDAGRGKTLGEFVSGYAPPGSNDTAGYVKKAANALGVKPDTPLSAIDPTRLTTFVAMQESSTRLSPQAAQAPATGPGLARKTTASEQQTQSQQTGQSASVNVARTGSAQPLEDFIAQQERVAQGYEDAIAQAGTGTQEQVQAIRNNRMALMQQAQDREAATTAAIAQRDARANAVKQKMQEVGSRKTDIGRLWKDKGTLGTMLGLVGVALRSRNATKFGGPNTALQYLENERKQDIEAQMEDRNSELRGLERELGSLDAAVPMLEARMNDALAKRTQALLQDEKSATVLANGRDLIAKLNLERDQKLAESARAYWGTLSQQQALSAQQTGTRSTGTEFSDTTAPGEAAEPAKQTAEEQKATAAADSLNSFYTTAGLIRDPKTGRWKPNDQGVVPPGFAESINPFDDNAVEAAAEAAAEAYGRLQSGGVIGEDEREAFQVLVGMKTGNRMQLAARANAIENTLRARLTADRRNASTAAPAAWKGKPEDQAPAPAVEQH